MIQPGSELHSRFNAGFTFQKANLTSEKLIFYMIHVILRHWLTSLYSTLNFRQFSWQHSEESKILPSSEKLYLELDWILHSQSDWLLKTRQACGPKTSLKVSPASNTHQQAKMPTALVDGKHAVHSYTAKYSDLLQSFFSQSWDIHQRTKAGIIIAIICETIV